MDLRQNRLVSKAENFVRSRLGIPQTWVKSQILDRHYVVRKGTVHATPDYDDAWLLALATHSRFAIDAGSNIGQAAFVLLYPDTINQMILVEPNPKALALAADNLIRNHLVHRVRFVCAFASDKVDKSIKFWTIGTGSAGSMYAAHAVTASKQHQSYEVPTTTIDSICETFQFLPDLVKIDTEGAEHLMLQGSISLASQQKTRFFVEMHSNVDNPMLLNAHNVLNWCQDNHYRAWYLSEKVELTMPEQIQKRGRCHLLLQPAEWQYPAFLQLINQGMALEDAIRNLISP